MNQIVWKREWELLFSATELQAISLSLLAHTDSCTQLWFMNEAAPLHENPKSTPCAPSQVLFQPRSPPSPHLIPDYEIVTIAIQMTKELL